MVIGAPAAGTTSAYRLHGGTTAAPLESRMVMVTAVSAATGLPSRGMVVDPACVTGQ